MLVEFGHNLLILAGLIAMQGALLPILLSRFITDYKFSASIPFVTKSIYLVFVLLGASIAILLFSFLNDDFSVTYVAMNSCKTLPLYYKAAALWAGHSGSLLLWLFILSFWSVVVYRFSSELSAEFRARVSMVFLWVIFCFTVIVLFTSNPFERMLPFVPIDGADLNPMLQDFALTIHPPILFIGYVGTVVPFAYVIAGMCCDKDFKWVSSLKAWVSISFCALIVGIVLGSWWAYYELGWGGYWFWDPVENASLMPWLALTALLHVSLVVNTRGNFKHWLVLLSITAYSLSIIGTFLVRSGLLSSVHSFAYAPGKGLLILFLLAITTIPALVLYFYKSESFSAPRHPEFKLFSRDFLLLFFAVILVVDILSILLATFYPLFLEILDIASISVGPDYYNKVFKYTTLLTAIVMPIGVRFKYKENDLKNIIKIFVIPFILSVSLSIVLAMFITFLFKNMISQEIDYLFYISCFIFSWVLIQTLYLIPSKLKLKSFCNISMAYWGMLIAHLGFALSILGIAVMANFEQQSSVALKIGQEANLGSYSFEFRDLYRESTPHKNSITAEFIVKKQGVVLENMLPQKVFFKRSSQVMTETALSVKLWGDLYIMLGNALPDDKWAVTISIKPFIRFIWGGGIMIAIGAVLAFYGNKKRAREKAKS